MGVWRAALADAVKLRVFGHYLRALRHPLRGDDRNRTPEAVRLAAASFLGAVALMAGLYGTLAGTYLPEFAHHFSFDAILARYWIPEDAPAHLRPLALLGIMTAFPLVALAMVTAWAGLAHGLVRLGAYVLARAGRTGLGGPWAATFVPFLDFAGIAAVLYLLLAVVMAVAAIVTGPATSVGPALAAGDPVAVAFAVLLAVVSLVCTLWIALLGHLWNAAWIARGHGLPVWLVVAGYAAVLAALVAIARLLPD